MESDVIPWSRYVPAECQRQEESCARCYEEDEYGTLFARTSHGKVKQAREARIFDIEIPRCTELSTSLFGLATFEPTFVALF